MNIELALEVIGAIELYPETHNQESWCHVKEGGRTVSTKEMLNDPPCGTTLCFAGWAAALRAPNSSVFTWGDSGGVYTPSKIGEYVKSKDGDMVPHDSLFDPVSRAVRYNREGIGDFARKALGIDQYQSGYLFDPARTVEELLSGVRCLIANPRATVDELHASYRQDQAKLHLFR